jgi:hypothetical protein
VKKKQDKLNDVNNTEEERKNQEKQRRKDEDRLVDLALEWNYIDGVLPILQSRQDSMRKKGQEYSEVRLYLIKIFTCRFILGRDQTLQTII